MARSPVSSAIISELPLMETSGQLLSTLDIVIFFGSL
ncbi:MAG: hypothetical protein ACI8V5_002445, partial [Limisphaerales bacterium]